MNAITRDFQKTAKQYEAIELMKKHTDKLGLEKAMKGSDNPKAKLTNEQVLEIRAYALEHGYLKNRKELSKKYNVGEGTLKDIVKKRRGVWRHI